ncbi:hypothetical protein [Kribbella sp. CA-294648]|uniref:hypothetical protein n=1 Tax=Kribbella sp. CA-294648 TaxID=3239948 RepID=UPI003D91A1CB
MERKNGRLVALVSSVAVAAVVTGGVLAYRQAPNDGGGSSAAPLPGQPTPKASVKTPSRTPVLTPSATPSSTPTLTSPSTPPVTAHPVEIEVDLAGLATGPGTDVTHLAGREVRGGGPTVKIPGSQRIVEFARLGNGVVAMVRTDGGGDELLVTGTGQPTRRIPHVSTLAADETGTAAAYSTTVVNPDGVVTRGGSVHYLSAGGTAKTLALPGDTFALRVVAVLDGKVYYKSTDEHADVERLYEWSPATTTPKLVKAITATAVLSRDGRYATSHRNGPSSVCHAVRVVATGKKLWETCKADLLDFTPDSGVTIGRGYAGGTAMIRITAQDTKTGKLLHAWTGFFENVVAEDNQHVLISTAGATGAAFIRCAVSTGACEYAVPPGDAELRLDSRMTI